MHAFSYDIAKFKVQQSICTVSTGFHINLIIFILIVVSSVQGLKEPASNGRSLQWGFEDSAMLTGNDWSDFRVKPAILTRSSETKLPYFDRSTDQQVVVSPGVTAYLHCRVRNLGSKVVSWIRQRDFHILTVGVFRYTNYGQFTALHKEGTDDWTLQISQPTTEDSGLYECQVSSSPKISRFIKLIVRVADESFLPKHDSENPNSMAITSKGRRWKNDYEENEDEPETKTVIPAAPDFFVKEGGTVTITCQVINSNIPPKYIKWYHREQEITYGPKTPRVRIHFTPGYNSTSSLKILKVNKADTGKYTCQPSNSYEAHGSIHMIEEDSATAVFQKSKSSASKSTKMEHYTFYTLLAGIIYFENAISLSM